MSPEETYDDEVAALYRKSARKGLAFLCSMGCDRGLAEEITDDAFLGARRHWVKVRTYDQPEGYVFMIARNERSKRQKKHDDQAWDLHPDPPEPTREPGKDPAQQVIDGAAIRQALQRLPPKQREAVCLRHIGDLSEEMTAELMNVSTGCVKRYAHEGRKALRELLAEFRPRRKQPMIADDELLTSSLVMLGDSQIDDAELDQRVAAFKGSLRRLRDDPAEAARVDALVADAELDRKISKLANVTDNEITGKRDALQGSSMLAAPGRSIARVTAWGSRPSMLTSAGQARAWDLSASADSLWDEGPGSPGFGFAAEKDGAIRLVRPYTVAGGRTQPRYQLAIEALVTATVLEPRDLSVLAPECQAILQFCRDWRSVAEVSAVLRLPLGVARILIADMSAEGLVRIHQRDDPEGRPDLHLLERVLRGLRKI